MTSATSYLPAANRHGHFMDFVEIWGHSSHLGFHGQAPSYATSSFCLTPVQWIALGSDTSCHFHLPQRGDLLICSVCTDGFAAWGQGFWYHCFCACACGNQKTCEGLAQWGRILWGDTVQGVLQGRVAVDAFGSSAATASCLFWIQDCSSLFIHFLQLPLLCLKPGLWLPPSGTVPALHLELTFTLWAHPKCRPRSPAGPSSLMTMEIFRSSVDFFYYWFLQLANMLLFFLHLSTETWSEKAAGSQKNLVGSVSCKSFSWVHSSAKYGNGLLLFIFFSLLFFLFFFLLILNCFWETGVWASQNQKLYQEMVTQVREAWEGKNFDHGHYNCLDVL